MMNKLKAKLKKQGGFTLVEMLIVVAIIAILVAVSIPLVGSALEQARIATDGANERSFKAALVSGYLLTQAGMNEEDEDITADTIYAYDAVNGKVVAKGDLTNTKYGKSNGKTESALYGFVEANGDVKMQWLDAEPGNSGGITNGNLVSPDLVTNS